MQFQSLAALIALLATAQASSVCDYFGKDCGRPCNKQQIGNTPLNCTLLSTFSLHISPWSRSSYQGSPLTKLCELGNTQQGAALGYTVDKACSLTFYSDNNCQHASQSFGSATKGCHDFSGTGGSWLFHC
jgi:hypothetical protein